MRIGIDIRCLTEGKLSGVEEYVVRTLKELLEYDKHNQYVLFFNSFRGSRVQLDWLSRYPNVEIKDYRFPNKLLNFCLWLFRWPKIDRLIGGVNLLFAPNIGFLALSGDCKFVLTIHDLSFERFPETFSLKRRLWHFIVNPRALCKQADKIFAVSNSTKLDLQSLYGMPGSKVIVSYPPLDYSDYDQANLTEQRAEAIMEKYRIRNDNIMFFGTIEPRKNIEALIDAYHLLREECQHMALPDLVIAGARGWKYESILEKYSSSPHKNYIHFTDFVEDSDKPYVYKLAKIMVYPSLFEGFGFPPLEAMAAGVPVITSNCSSIPEIVNGAALLIDPYRPYEITIALRTLLENPRLRASYVLKGKERIKQLQASQRTRLTELEF